MTNNGMQKENRKQKKQKKGKKGPLATVRKRS
jgi:hypothetical protein